MRILQVLRCSAVGFNVHFYRKASVNKKLIAIGTNVFSNSLSFPKLKSWHAFGSQVISSKCLHLSAVKNEKESTNSDEHEICIYTGPLRKRLKIVKAFSLSTSVVGLSLFPLVLYDLLKVNIYVCVFSGLISSVFLASPLILHHITKRYVVELNFNPQNKIFTAKTLNLFTQIKELNFTAEDVFVPTVPGFLSSFEVKGIPLFVDARMIEDADAYSHMMGYDKPLDLLIHTKDDEKLKMEQSSEKS